MAEAEPERTVGELLEQLRGRDPEAANAIFQRFARRLVGMARLRLNERLRQKVDAEDVVQSVFRSFFDRCARGQFEFENWEGMWGLLVRLTIWKCGRRVEYFRAGRRDYRRETATSPEDDGAVLEALADDPTPAEAAILADTTEQVMRRLNSDKKRRIFELSLQGYGVREISDMVQHYERGVERVRQEVKTILREMLEQNFSQQ